MTVSNLLKWWDVPRPARPWSFIEKLDLPGPDHSKVMLALYAGCRAKGLKPSGINHNLHHNWEEQWKHADA